MSKTTDALPQELPPFYPAKHYSGMVSFNENRTNCGVAAEIANDGSLRIELDDIPVNSDTEFLFEAWKTGATFPLFSVEASSEDGDRLSSGTIFFTSPRAREYFTLSGSCNEAKIVRQRRGDEAPGTIMYHLRGFENAGTLRAPTSFGRLLMAGSWPSDTTKIQGGLKLEAAADAVSDAGFRGEVAELFEHVIWIMSFANGSMLKDPVRRFVHDSIVELEVRRIGISPRPLLPPFHPLHRQPIFNHAVSSYFGRREEVREVRAAIEYLLIDANYTEARLMMTVIALEHIANRVLEENDHLRIDKDRFLEMCEPVLQALDETTIPNCWRGRIREAILGRNAVSFREKIDRFIRKWNIPMRNFPPHALRNIVLVRNAIAHGRLLHEDERTKNIEAWGTLLAMRDLMTRIVLSRIGFVGNYESYIDGQHMREFPSCKRLP